MAFTTVAINIVIYVIVFFDVCVPSAPPTRVPCSLLDPQNLEQGLGDRRLSMNNIICADEKMNWGFSPGSHSKPGSRLLGLERGLRKEPWLQHLGPGFGP